jgi:hypothetical protein
VPKLVVIISLVVDTIMNIPPMLVLYRSQNGSRLGGNPGTVFVCTLKMHVGPSRPVMSFQPADTFVVPAKSHTGNYCLYTCKPIAFLTTGSLHPCPARPHLTRGRYTDKADHQGSAPQATRSPTAWVPRLVMLDMCPHLQTTSRPL